MKKYGWNQLNQWETPPKDAYITHKRVKTNLSEAVCSYMLVKRIDQGGHMRCVYVKKEDVSQGILNAAENI